MICRDRLNRNVNSSLPNNLENLRIQGSFRRKIAKAAALLAATGLSAVAPTPASAQIFPPDASTLVSVCSGVSLPPSFVTSVIEDPLLQIYGPIENDVNGILGALALIPGTSPLAVDVSGILASAAGGSNIGIDAVAVAQDGVTIVGPSDQCDATADSYTLDNPAGISIGGNMITGLGDPFDVATAGEIDSVAIGNRASTDASAVGAIAIGPDAAVGSGATGSIAFGSNSGVSVANSVALGADSRADRGAVPGVSVGEVSVGTPGNERQITNVADATQLTDAVNLGQLQAATDNAVQYDDASHLVVSFDGVGGTLLTNVLDGAVNATSTDAVNGSQLYATNQVIANLALSISNGAAGPVQYSDPGTPTTPNGGVPTNDVTLVGAAPGAVGLHNVADGVIAAGSTDAVNGGQIYNLTLGMADAVIYDDSTHTSVTLNSGGPATTVHNVAAGVAPNDAVNVQQLNSVAGTTLVNANSYTDLRIEELQFDLNDRLKDVRDDAFAGSASALAAAGMPQAMNEGRTMIAGGVGTYRGEVGFAVGASYRAANGQSVYKVGMTYDSSRHVGASAGAGFQF